MSITFRAKWMRSIVSVAAMTGLAAVSLTATPQKGKLPRGFSTQIYWGVDPVKQKGQNQCWAAAAAMLENLKRAITQEPILTPKQTAALGGPLFEEIFDQDVPLHPSFAEAFYRKLGWTVLSGENRSLEEWWDLIKIAPLQVTLGSPGEGIKHAIVVTTIAKGSNRDGEFAQVTWIDPIGPTEVTRPFKEFQSLYWAATDFPISIVYRPLWSTESGRVSNAEKPVSGVNWLERRTTDTRTGMLLPPSATPIARR